MVGRAARRRLNEASAAERRVVAPLRPERFAIRLDYHAVAQDMLETDASRVGREAPVARPYRASYFFTHDEARAAATRRPAAARETGWRWRWWRWSMLADKRAQAALAAGLCVWAGLLHWNISCMC